MHTLSIGPYNIGSDHPPFIVAEISANHRHSLQTALSLLEAAKAAGAHAVKLQTYTPDTITLPLNTGAFIVQDPGSPWNGRQLYDLYKEAYTPWDWHAALFEKCRSLDLLCFSTPFDSTAVDFLEQLNVPCYKIASLEAVDLPLIRKVASTKKPLLLSTGACTLGEIAEAVACAKAAGCTQLLLMKCPLAYPAPTTIAHLRTLPHLQASFNVPVGFSDHTAGIGAAIASIAFGSCVIEKHFTISRQEGGVDASFSLEPPELRLLVEESLRAWQALGSIQYGPTPTELPCLSLRRSLYFVKDMSAGSTVSADALKSLRPGEGLSPIHYEQIIGLTLRQDVSYGQAVQWEHFISPSRTPNQKF